MAAYIRKVRAASGATAVQIAEKKGGRRTILEHLGSAHTDSELVALMQAARVRLDEGQEELDLGLDVPTGPGAGPSVITAKRSRWLIEAIETGWRRLGFDEIDDDAFFQLVLGRLVEPTSMSDTYATALKRCATRDYRDRIATKCFEHAAETGGLSLVLYDVTTLYFEAEKEDELRKVGYSKERRVDPQIVVGLLVDRTGFPLEIGCFEGNQAETHTIVPIIRQFQDRHDIAGVEMVVAADAGMLSATNLKSLDDAGLKFIVGSRVTKAPIDLANHFHWNGDVFTDGQIIDTVTPRHAKSTVNNVRHRTEPVWDPVGHPKSWRAVWHYRSKRAVRDNQTLNAQETRARDVVDGGKAPKSTRFVKTTTGGRSLDTASIERARSLVGLKGYVTNVPATLMGPEEVIGKYHDLWHVEQSFRMSKTDLRARPMFHRTRDAIEAHLTVVFTALAVARYLQAETGISIRSLVRTLRPLQEITMTIAGHPHTATDPITPDAAAVLAALDLPTRGPGH
ncbi:IS1634 family transposase [Prescottella subtropica]|uniref:IS1634 family transposase n=1 Tax=Prescottella subtropica TaxID=2545757 RepID=UPI0010F87646|nr:IS1634 family transposase [Prescottella subtropica]